MEQKLDSANRAGKLLPQTMRKVLVQPALATAAEDLSINQPTTSKSTADAGTANLPTAVESLGEKIARFLSEKTSNEGNHSEELIAASISSQPPRLFSVADGVDVVKTF